VSLHHKRCALKVSMCGQKQKVAVMKAKHPFQAKGFVSAVQEYAPARKGTALALKERALAVK
jgi:hypothetical protein